MIRLIHPQHPPQRLRWTDQHPASHYGLGVVLLGQGREVLAGVTFKIFAAEGWRIECGAALERRRVAGALAWGALGVPAEFLKIKCDQINQRI